MSEFSGTKIEPTDIWTDIKPKTRFAEVVSGLDIGYTRAMELIAEKASLPFHRVYKSSGARKPTREDAEKIARALSSLAGKEYLAEDLWTEFSELDAH